MKARTKTFLARSSLMTAFPTALVAPVTRIIAHIPPLLHHECATQSCLLSVPLFPARMLHGPGPEGGALLRPDALGGRRLSPPFLVLYAQNDFSARVPLEGLLKCLGCLSYRKDP